MANTSTAINMANYAAQILRIPQNDTPPIIPDYIEQLADTYKRIQSEIKALEKRQDTIKQELIAEMDSRQAEEVTAGAFTIRYKLVESVRLDTAALKANAPDIYTQYSKPSVTTRLTVN